MERDELLGKLQLATSSLTYFRPPCQISPSNAITFVHQVGQSKENSLWNLRWMGLVNEPAQFSFVQMFSLWFPSVYWCQICTESLGTGALVISCSRTGVDSNDCNKLSLEGKTDVNDDDWNHMSIMSLRLLNYSVYHKQLPRFTLLCYFTMCFITLVIHKKNILIQTWFICHQFKN